MKEILGRYELEGHRQHRRWSDNEARITENAACNARLDLDDISFRTPITESHDDPPVVPL